MELKDDNKIVELKDDNKILESMLNIEYVSHDDINDIDIRSYSKFPLSELSTLGVGISSLSEATRTITETVGVEGLYKCILPEGAVKLAQAKDGSGALGAAMGANGRLKGQARWILQDNATQVTTIPFNPAMLFMAVAIMGIDKKLDHICEMQKEIIQFLEQKEKAKLKGSLDTLYDVLNNYKYNWENEKYKTNKHILVQSIKHEATQSINFYKNRICEKMNKRMLLHSDKTVKSKMNKIYLDFKNYQLALYIFAFSSFVEVLLLGNFAADYLNSICKSIEDMSFKYREIYTEFYNRIEGHANTSVESYFLSGLSTVTKVSGNLISKVPVVSKAPIDSALIGTSEKLEKIESNKNNKTLKNIVNVKSSEVNVFVDNIDRLNRLYNEPMELLIDKENIYIKE